MRISDWSSDVCSSDLGRIGTFAACRDGLVQERVAGNSATTCIETTCAQLGPGATGCRRPLRGDAGDVQFAAPIMGAQKRGAAQTRPGSGANHCLHGRAYPQPLAGMENGRAPVRGSVGQYV